METEQRVQRAKGDEKEFEALLKDYRPFIAAAASRGACKYVSEHDDEMSIALIAFSEAVQRFRPESGRFLPFAKQVIHSRLVDEARSNSREVKSVPYELSDDGKSVESQRATSLDSRFDDPVKLEIESLSATLKTYGFGFADVAKCSPKHKSTKKDCARAVRCILDHPEFQEQMIKSRQLPASGIQKLTGIPLKLIERHRIYIVCLTEILLGEYAYLSEYVKSVREA